MYGIMLVECFSESTDATMSPDQLFQELPPFDILLRLLSAWAFGMLMGIERERHGRAASVRTMGLVSAGASLFTILSISLVGDHSDPGRIAANIVTGIGFLGAGAIMRYGTSVHDLTTAASVWMGAAIGMACGFGAFVVASMATALALLTLVILRPLSHGLRPTVSGASIAMSVKVSPELLQQIAEHIRERGGAIVKMELGPERGKHQLLLVEATFVEEADLGELVGALACLKGVSEAHLV